MLTQHQLIIEYIKEHGSILPAKCYGLVYKDQMLGSETSKRCRELRAKGVLRSEQEGKFERFYLVSTYDRISKMQEDANKAIWKAEDDRKFKQFAGITADEFLKRFPSQVIKAEENIDLIYPEKQTTLF